MGTLINRGAGWTASDIAADTGSVYVTNVGSSSNSLAKYSLDFANAQGRLCAMKSPSLQSPSTTAAMSLEGH